MKWRYFLLALFVCQGCKNFAQPQRLEVFADRLTYYNYVTITIRYGAERYNRTEVNLIYRKGSEIKMHSIIKEPSALIDTLFTLSGKQMMIIDRFYQDVRNDNMKPTETVYAGSRGCYEIIIDDKKYQLESKKDYSLFREISQAK